MTSNYDDVLGQLREFGLLVDHLVVGRRQRCKVEDGGREKRGWYHLHDLRLDSGEEVLVGSFGQWRGNENNAQKVALRKTRLSAEQQESLRARLREDRLRADREARAMADRAAQAAQAAWRKCSESGDSDYLARKAVAPHGVRFSPGGAMVIPMLDVAGVVHGLQLIRGKARRAGQLEKEFWPAGLAKKGHFHQIGMPGPIILVGEGYATCASVFAATQLPIAVAFDAGNIQPVAMALHKRYKTAKILIVADDDATQKCQQPGCRKPVWLPDGPTCPHCGQPHNAVNAGITAASNAALAVGGAWVAPQFADVAKQRADWLQHGRKANDFNDLQMAEGLHAVRAQVEARLTVLGWRATSAPARAVATQGGGEVLADGQRLPAPLRPIETLDELLERFTLVYAQNGTVFDAQEHILMPVSDMRDACLTRELHRAWAEHPGRTLVRVQEVGFDPACTDPMIRCNLWAGWPTVPRAGSCEHQLELLRHMCQLEGLSEELFWWVIRWLAYPLQHPGAKMRTAIVIHGPQGTGKNLFFEGYMGIFGPYGRVIDQAAIEDKHNEWASRKLFLISDEVIARSDLYHIKNKLKAFISGDTLRINPKNITAYEERNHVNMVFLSNEAMPVVLEEDDRRHAVIWTPAQLPQDFYAKVRAEQADGGIAALHHYLLHVDLGDFHEGTRPPMTDAKRELIDLGKDSPTRFYEAYAAGEIDGFPSAKSQIGLLSPVLPLDLYELYGEWCKREGLRALPNPRFSNALMRKHGKTTRSKRYYLGAEQRGPSGVTYLDGGPECPPGQSESHWIGERVEAFRASLKKYRNAGAGSPNP